MILIVIETIYSNIFRSNYIRQKTIFGIFFFYFVNLDKIWNIFKKKKTLIPHVFLNLGSPKKVVRQMSKKSRFREPLDK